MNSINLESIRQRYLNVRSNLTSEDPGLIMCKSLINLMVSLGLDRERSYIERELWILMTKGKTVLAEHRSVPKYY